MRTHTLGMAVFKCFEPQMGRSKGKV